MTPIRDGYFARWNGEEYEASPDGDDVRLYRPDAADGFEQVREGRYRRVLPAGEVRLEYVRTGCMWKSEPFLILAEHEGWLRVEYTGGLAPVARRLGLEEFEYGVYQGWAPLSEVTDVREHRL
jgi:hypothetical protein